MKATAENYKGINYVRISSLPKEQSANLQASFNKNLIIKILRDGTLLQDCLQYDHYVAWYENIYKAQRTQATAVKLGLPSDWAIAS